MTADPESHQPLPQPILELPTLPRFGRGVYLWGAVGTGKSMLMDMFFDESASAYGQDAEVMEGQDTTCPSWERQLWAGPQVPGALIEGVRRDSVTMTPLECLGGGALPPVPPESGVRAGVVRRVHFHEFMAEVHAHMHAAREGLLASFGRRGVSTSGTGFGATGPPPPNLRSKRAQVDVFERQRDVACLAGRRIAHGTVVLCLDEMQVTDVVDAVVVSRVFGELFRLGVQVVATSNRPMGDLYADGLNRDMFVPFLDLLSGQCREVKVETSTDFRRTGAAATGAGDAGERCRILPGGGEDRDWLRAAVRALADDAVPGGDAPATVVVPLPHGRSMEVEAVGSAAVVSFEQLCDSEHGAGDYRALARRFGAIGLAGARRLKPSEQDAARRFVTLVDELYEARTLVALTCGAHPDELLRAIELGDDGGDAVRSAEELEDVADPAAAFSAEAQQHAAAAQELRFACARAASRLAEMLGPAYAAGASRTRTLERRA